VKQLLKQSIDKFNKASRPRDIVSSPSVTADKENESVNFTNNTSHRSHYEQALSRQST
jgi:hypothetical protein